MERAHAYYKEHPGDKDAMTNYHWAVFSVFALLLIVILFNKLCMSVLFHKFTDLERSETTSKFQYSFAFKYCLGLFFTTALMTLVVEAITLDNYYRHEYRVIEVETIMFFLNSFFVPLFWLIHPFYLAKRLQQYFKFGKKYLPQSEANELMEYAEYDMGKRYAEVIEVMWFTFLYATLIPLGTLISCAGLMLYYWVDKYNLLRRSAIKTEVSGRLVIESMNLLDLTLLLLPLGSILFDLQVRKTYTISSIVMIVASFVYMVLPTNKLINYLNAEDFHPEEKSYDEVKHSFKYTYQTERSIYKLLRK